MNAAETFGEVMFTEGYVLGGAEPRRTSPSVTRPPPMFEDPPSCWLHRQASFINAFFPEDAVAGEDYDWFPLPPIDQEGTLYAGELTVVGQNRPEVVDFLERFIAETSSARWAASRRRPGSRPTSTSGRTATPTTSWPTPR